MGWGNLKAPTPYHLHMPIEVPSPNLKPTIVGVFVVGKVWVVMNEGSCPQKRLTGYATCSLWL